MSPLVMSGVAVDELLRGVDGPVTRHCMERATVIQEAARLQITTREYPHGPPPGVMPGRLAASLVKRILPDGGIWLGSELFYALWVHDGNGPQGGRIFPKRSNVLVFHLGSMLVFAKSVSTSRPNRYLLDNLHLAAV